MLPKYTYFKLHDPAAHKYHITLEYRRDLVKRQITLCKNNINTLNLESQNLKSSIIPEHYTYNSTNAHSYKAVMYIQTLHHLGNN